VCARECHPEEEQQVRGEGAQTLAVPATSELYLKCPRGILAPVAPGWCEVAAKPDRQALQGIIPDIQEVGVAGGGNFVSSFAGCAI
jgi:hypothetical protein